MAVVIPGGSSKGDIVTRRLRGAESNLSRGARVREANWVGALVVVEVVVLVVVVVALVVRCGGGEVVVGVLGFTEPSSCCSSLSTSALLVVD